MAFVIGEPCVDHMDQSCITVCPVDCISYEQGVDRKLFIDPDNCIDCGSCEQVCPNTAIRSADNLPAAWADYAWIDAAWFRDPDAARDVLAEVLAGKAA
jgi:NAD-dependent dihydropyrimidine dehydrogenase PreA subunit